MKKWLKTLLAFYDILPIYIYTHYIDTCIWHIYILYMYYFLSLYIFVRTQARSNSNNDWWCGKSRFCIHVVTFLPPGLGWNLQQTVLMYTPFLSPFHLKTIKKKIIQEHVTILHCKDNSVFQRPAGSFSELGSL